MNRREVIRKFLAGSTVLFFVPTVLDSCSKSSADNSSNPGGGTRGTKIEIDLSLPEYSLLSVSGNSKVIQNILVINSGANFIALSSICTHQGCTVGYNAGAGDIECPCHGSVFSTSGSVINGPAASGLRSFPVSLTGNILTITL